MKQFPTIWDRYLGTIINATHRIGLTLPYIRQIHSAPHRTVPKARESEKEGIDQMLKEKVIDPAQTKWASSDIFLPKKNGILHFCVLYRMLKSVTVRYSFPLLWTNKCIQLSVNARVNLKLVVSSVYRHSKVDKEDRKKIAFTHHYGLYRFIRMTIFLKNAARQRVGKGRSRTWVRQNNKKRR